MCAGWPWERRLTTPRSPEWCDHRAVPRLPLPRCIALRPQWGVCAVVVRLEVGLLLPPSNTPRRWPRLPASPRSGLLPAIPIHLRRGGGGYLFGSQTYSILLRFSETIFTHLCNVVHEYSGRVTSGSKVK